jgi:hypothetical protein
MSFRKKTDTATLIACTTTIPTYFNTTAPTTLETTTTSEASNRALDVRHVTLTPTPTAALLETKPTNTAATATDLNDAISMDEQRDNKKSGVGREEEEKGVEKQERVREQEVDTGEQERIEGIQSEVQTPVPLPTACLAFNPMLHEPVRFDWAAEVDEALSLSPITLSNCTPAASVPNNLIPDDIPVDPVCTKSTNSTPCSPTAPTQPVRTTPKSTVTLPDNDVAAHGCGPPMGALIVPHASTPVSPNIPTAALTISGASPNVNGMHPTTLPTTPHAPNPVSLKPASCDATVTPAPVIPIDPAPVLPILPEPSDVAIGVVLAKTVPTNLIPNDSAPVAPTLAIPGVTRQIISYL